MSYRQGFLAGFWFVYMRCHGNQKKRTITKEKKNAVVFVCFSLLPGEQNRLFLNTFGIKLCCLLLAEKTFGHTTWTGSSSKRSPHIALWKNIEGKRRKRGKREEGRGTITNIN